MGVKIRKKATGKWIVDINYNNKQRRITVGSKRQALSLKDEVELEIARHKLGFLTTKSKPIYFQTIADEWFFEHKDKVKQATTKRYRSVLKLHLIPALGKQDIRNIRRSNILKYLRKLQHNGSSSSFIHVVSCVLTQVFLYAVDLEIIENSPTTDVIKSLRLKKPVNNTKPFTNDDIVKIINVAPEKDKVFFLFAFRTGCRVGECLGLHWDDIDFENGTVTIKRTCNMKIVGTPKNNKQRTIDLSPQLVQALHQYRKLDLEDCIKTGRKPEVVFNYKGTYMYSKRVRRAWTKMLKAVDIPYIKFHHIRHSVASLLIAAGVNPSAVQHQLGHASAQFTMDMYVQYIKGNQAITQVLDNNNIKNPGIFQVQAKL